MNNLRAFGRDHGFEIMQSPVGAFATDRALVVCVPSYADEYLDPCPSTIADGMNAMHAQLQTLSSTGEWLDAASLALPQPIPCPVCTPRGLSGTPTPTVPDPWCDECYGSGEKYTPVLVGAMHFKRSYLQILRDHLPADTKVCTAPKRDGGLGLTHALFAQWDGGWAVLAGCLSLEAAARRRMALTAAAKRHKAGQP